MQLTSTAFGNNQPLPARYTHQQGNVSPPLQITDVPSGARSLALIVTDSDAPGGTFTHWLVWNIQPSTGAIAEGTAPAGATQGTNDFGDITWDGPAPPSGTHHYHCTLYALDTRLGLPPQTTRQGVEAAMQRHILETTELTGTFSAP